MITRRQFLHRSGLLLASRGFKFKESAFASPTDTNQWATEFEHPPWAAYPWVFAFWMEGNITKEGITNDLEEMKRAGISGMEFFCADLGNPRGPHPFMSESWYELFNHLLAESDRLGLQIDANVAPGWAGSGGRWITPEMASQQVIAAERVLKGPSRYESACPRPGGVRHGYYRDIAVLAYPLPGGAVPSYRIPDFNSSKSFAGGQDFEEVVPWPPFIPTNPDWPVVPENETLDPEKMLDITDRLKSGDTLTWDVPPGNWLVLRFGHTVANGATRESPPEAAGLECDKMSQAAIELQFDSMVGEWIDRAGPLAGKVLTSIHVDSWEAGSGNWTDGFRSQFQKRRGYDLLPYLPTLNGIVVGSREMSERFLWDFRETINELLLDNYATHLRDLAHSKGVQLSIEAYGGTCDDLRYAGCADVPMTEFWTGCYSGLPLSDLTESMASAAHVYGKPIVSAEAFTSFRGDFLDHPATLKPLADWAFCTGVNHFCLSEWVMQPWPHVVPGVSFGRFGTIFHSSLTWWPMAKPWHEYIARCQWMLRQGKFVADVCFIAPEGAPCRFTAPMPATVRGVIPDRPEYNFDGCPAELIIEQMKVKGHAVTLPSGMEYELLVLPTYDAMGERVVRLTDSPDNYYYKPEPLPSVQTMTPELLRKIVELVKQGATVLGYRPIKSPSLAEFPDCDKELTKLADELWGTGDGYRGKGHRKVGIGEVFWGWTPEDVLREKGIACDFCTSPNLKGKINYTHRRLDDGSDVYMVVNQEDGFVDGYCMFRAASGQPELYWPETGKSSPVLAYEIEDSTTRIPISLNANESVFVVFRSPVRPSYPVVSLIRDGVSLWPATSSAKPLGPDDSFEIAQWMYPLSKIDLPEPCEGGWTYQDPAPRTIGDGYQETSSPGQGAGGFALGANGVVVFQYGAGGEVQPLLAFQFNPEIKRPVLVGVIYREKIPRLYINGKLVSTGPKNRFPSLPGGGWADRKPFAGEIAALRQFQAMLRDAGVEGLEDGSMPITTPGIDLLHRKIWRPGEYSIKTAQRGEQHFSIYLPPPQEITGPWNVEFDPNAGGPGSVRFDALTDWAKHENPGIRYYSGSASYRKEFEYHSTGRLSENAEITLDLGEVASLAAVTLNGKYLGVAWKRPYHVEVGDALQEGRNTLEIKVANMWVNRLIGDAHLPEDCERNAAGLALKWPQWMLDGKKSPAGRHTFTSFNLWGKDDPLVQSGLLGPVRLIAFHRI
jgi:hypothetical protein